MMKYKSFFRFSSKIVKMDIESILSSTNSTTPKGQNCIPNSNMLLYYYPINKESFENFGAVNGESNSNTQECFNSKCEDVNISSDDCFNINFDCASHEIGNNSQCSLLQNKVKLTF